MLGTEYVNSRCAADHGDDGAVDNTCCGLVGGRIGGCDVENLT